VQGMGVLILRLRPERTSRMGLFLFCVAWFLLSGVDGIILARLGRIGLIQRCARLRARLDSRDLASLSQY
jgi:hypothetical protein